MAHRWFDANYPKAALHLFDQLALCIIFQPRFFVQIFENFIWTFMLQQLFQQGWWFVCEVERRLVSISLIIQLDSLSSLSELPIYSSISSKVSSEPHTFRNFRKFNWWRYSYLWFAPTKSWEQYSKLRPPTSVQSSEENSTEVINIVKSSTLLRLGMKNWCHYYQVISQIFDTLSPLSVQYPQRKISFSIMQRSDFEENWIISHNLSGINVLRTAFNVIGFESTAE